MGEGFEGAEEGEFCKPFVVGPDMCKFVQVWRGTIRVRLSCSSLLVIYKANSIARITYVNQ